jgi:hypothetical protein
VCVDAGPAHHVAAVLDGLPPGVPPPEDKTDLAPRALFWRPLQPAVDAFAAFSAAKSPEEKRDLLIVCVKSVFQCVRSLNAGRSGPGEKRGGFVNIDADSMVGMFCYLAVHACVPNLYAQVTGVDDTATGCVTVVHHWCVGAQSDFLGDFLNEMDAIQIAGFYLTSVQSALTYLVSVRPSVLPCGFCEVRSPQVREIPHAVCGWVGLGLSSVGAGALPFCVRQVQCKTCVRRLCDRCDVYIHGSATCPPCENGRPDVASTPIAPDDSGHVRIRCAVGDPEELSAPLEQESSPTPDSNVS